MLHVLVADHRLFILQMACSSSQMDDKNANSFTMKASITNKSRQSEEITTYQRATVWAF